jgi:hypothetical protein
MNEELNQKRKPKWKTGTDTPTYSSWVAMRNRVRSDGKDSKYYKDKNITVCERWEGNFNNFLKDMGERPFGTTLDRIDGNGNYCPENCRWATPKEQNNNKDSLTRIERNGITKTIGEWGMELELSKREMGRAYARHYGCGSTTFEEIFYDGNLTSLRTNKRKNCCAECGRKKSSKWYVRGKLCNTCYTRKYRKGGRLTFPYAGTARR